MEFNSVDWFIDSVGGLPAVPIVSLDPNRKFGG